VVAIFARRLAAGQSLRVHGDGRQTRDFLYAPDVAELVERAIAARAAGVFNAGTGVETSIADLAERLVALAGGGAVEHSPAVPGEQRRSVLDAGKAAAELGWRATTPLDAGLATTVEWFASAVAR
jgi:UDP-glucose 4-epimerase